MCDPVWCFSLFVCAGYQGTKACKRLDLNAENPSWSGFVSLPWRPYHFMLETVGDYMYAIGQLRIVLVANSTSSKS